MPLHLRVMADITHLKNLRINRRRNRTVPVGYLAVELRELGGVKRYNVHPITDGAHCSSNNVHPTFMDKFGVFTAAVTLDVRVLVGSGVSTGVGVGVGVASESCRSIIPDGVVVDTVFTVLPSL